MNRVIGEVVGQRASSLAIVYLTRRTDLEIMEPDGDSGMDLLVHIRSDDQQVDRVFGVEVKGLLSPNGLSQSNSGEWMFHVKPAGLEEKSTIPLCIFLFFMKTDEGFYKWLQEPAITEQGKAKLTLNLTGGFRELNREALDTIIVQVNHWYDAMAVGRSTAGIEDHQGSNAR